MTKICVTSEFGSVLMADASVRSGCDEVANGSMTIALDEARPMNIPNAVVKVADNVVSPLGATTAENYEAVKAGRSALRL